MVLSAEERDQLERIADHVERLLTVLATAPHLHQTLPSLAQVAAVVAGTSVDEITA